MGVASDDKAAPNVPRPTHMTHLHFPSIHSFSEGGGGKPVVPHRPIPRRPIVFGNGWMHPFPNGSARRRGRHDGKAMRPFGFSITGQRAERRSFSVSRNPVLTMHAVLHCGVGPPIWRQTRFLRHQVRGTCFGWGLMGSVLRIEKGIWNALWKADDTRFGNSGSAPPRNTEAAIGGWACDLRRLRMVPVRRRPPLFRRLHQGFAKRRRVSALRAGWRMDG